MLLALTEKKIGEIRDIYSDISGYTEKNFTPEKRYLAPKG